MCSTDPLQAEGGEYGAVAAQPVPPSTPRVAEMCRGCQPGVSGPCLHVPRRLGRRVEVPLVQKGALLCVGCPLLPTRGRSSKSWPGPWQAWAEGSGGRGMSLTSLGETWVPALALSLPSCLTFGPVTSFLSTSLLKQSATLCLLSLKVLLIDSVGKWVEKSLDILSTLCRILAARPVSCRRPAKNLCQAVWEHVQPCQRI